MLHAATNILRIVDVVTQIDQELRKTTLGGGIVPQDRGESSIP